MKPSTMQRACFLSIIMGIIGLAWPKTFYAQGSWEKISGPVKEVIVGYDQIESSTLLFKVEPGTGDIYSYGWIPGSWKKVGGPGKTFVVADIGHLYGLSPDGSGVMQYSGKTMSWKRIGGAAAEIYGGRDALYATNPETKDIYRYDYIGDKWSKVGGPGKMFAVGNPGHLYALGVDGSSVWKYEGVGTKWTQIGGPAAKIYAGGDKLYATNPQTGDIFRYDGQPMKWTKIGSPGKMFAVDTYGTLYGLSPNGKGIYKFSGTPDSWTKTGALAEEIYAGGQFVFAKNPVTNTLWRGTNESFAGNFYSLKPIEAKRQVLAILWDPHRPDHPAPSKADIEKVIFGPKPSVKDFFNENSDYHFTIEKAGLLGWFNADKPAEHYWANKDEGDANKDGWISGHVEKWAEAIRKADSSFDFGKFDKNKDKNLSPDELTILIVIPQNNPFGTQRDVVGRENPIQDLIVDGVKVPTMVEAYIGTSPSMGLVAHELSHILLGAGDMYFDKFQPYAAGPYSLMDQSPSFPPHLDPFPKLKLGWLYPKVITNQMAPDKEVVFDVETTNEVLVLYDVQRGNKEYFIVENRWGGNSYDKNLPHKGLAIWHIMEDAKTFEGLPAPTGVDASKWNEYKNQGWARNAIRMIRPIYGPPFNDALWDGSSASTGYDIMPKDPNPNHVSLKWADGSPSGFYIRSIPSPGPQMQISIEFRPNM
jgi:M6 family metalloprotease-like protein